jgi:hypothetical protein
MLALPEPAALRSVMKALTALLSVGEPDDASCPSWLA